MPPEEEPNKEESGKPPEAEVGAPPNPTLKAVVLTAVTTAIVTVIINRLSDRLFNQPEVTLGLIILTAVLAFIIFLKVTTRQDLILDWGFLVFLSMYVLTFFVAAETSLLDWKRSLVGYEKTIPANPLALNRFGDWHYWFVTEEPADKDMAIVLIKPPTTPQAGRLQIADLIVMAQKSPAKGVALDFYFGKYKEDKDEADKKIDELLCSEIENARAPNAQRPAVPVFTVYDYRLIGQRLDRLDVDPDLARCLPISNQGHGIGYAEWDGRVRSVPMYFENDRSLDAFSLKVARTFDSQVKVPESGLLQFLKPASDFPEITFDELEKDPERSILKDRFILVGVDSDRDSFKTPYGTKLGVLVHAYAIHSLRHSRFVKRDKGLTILLTIGPLVYLIMYMKSLGYRSLTLVIVNLVASATMVAISGLAMHFWLTWIDLVYPLLAAWLFLLGLMVIRIVAIARRRRSTETKPHEAC
jgi:hypothetical protein